MTYSAQRTRIPISRSAVRYLVAGGCASAVARGASTATTGGVGNPVVSTVEAGSSLCISALAIAAPVLAGIAVIVLLVLAIRKIGGKFRAGAACSK